MKKLISIVIPCYNEEDNILPMVNGIRNIFEQELSEYYFEIIFSDNLSQDRTRDMIRKCCLDDKRVKAIFNVKNFKGRSAQNVIKQSRGDACIFMACDFQDPIEMIPQFIKEWEKGYKIVCGIKSASKENKWLYKVRSLYYDIMSNLSDVEWIKQFTGFGLYDKEFVEVCRQCMTPDFLLRGFVAEMGYKIKEVPYIQEKRRAGISNNRNFYTLYDYAIKTLTSYSRISLRIASFCGIILSVGSLIIAIVFLILKLLYWDKFATGISPLLIGTFLIGGGQLCFIGLLGEYIMDISIRLRNLNRPLVIEEERINFD